MQMPRLLRTAQFRYAVGAALLFAFLSSIMGAFLYYGVRDGMERQLKEYIRTETSHLMGDYQDQGIDELVHDIRERVERTPSPRMLYVVEAPTGRRIFDRIDLPKQDGWSRIMREDRPDIILNTVQLEDGYWLGVGAEARGQYEFSRAFRHFLILAMGGIVLLSAVAGLLISQRFLARLKRFNIFAARVGEGDLSVRMPTEGMGEDLRPLADTVNRMLEQIEILLDDVRHTAVSIAHDLRTPLGHLRQTLESLTAYQSGAEARIKCEKAIAELDSILATFSSLLKIGELESGSAKVRADHVKLSELLEALAEAYAPVAEEAGQVLFAHITPSVKVSGDRNLLVQLFSNLLENAVRHAGAGAEIEVFLRREAGAAICGVSDSGPGIPRASQVDMLKPFRRMDASRSTRGSGLGLSLVRSIAARHEAELSLKNNAPGLVVELIFPKSY
ncbi:hypothetical protein HY11_00840 [Hyphomonas pacifica]|nr:hypothetical protein HY11_00840 [Hyphomonas pacifica]